MKHFPSLLPGLFVFAAAAAQVLYAVDTNTPAVDAKALAAFMQKWQTEPEYAYPDTRAAWPLLLAALAKDPNGPWATYVDTAAADARFHIRQVKWAERQSWATALLSTLQ